MKKFGGSITCRSSWDEVCAFVKKFGEVRWWSVGCKIVDLVGGCKPFFLLCDVKVFFEEECNVTVLEVGSLMEKL